MTKKVLTFTKKVLPNSNTFVASQALNLPNIKPVFIGFEKDVTGISLIQGADYCVMNEYSKLPRVDRLALEVFGYVNNNWKEALSCQQASLLHAHFGKGGYYCTPIAKQLDLPLITTFHGSDITQKDKHSYNKKHREVVFQNSDIILAVSNFIKKKLVSRGCPENKIIQHYTGIDTQFFCPTGDKTKHPSILFIGRLIKQKGCQYLLQAMKTINKASPETELIIIGDGTESKALKEQASSLNNVSFLGRKNKEQVKALMASAWLMCAPSITLSRGNEEGLGTVFLEAQAMGTPVVSFDTGGVAEAVVHESTGILVPEKNTAMLAEALLLLLTSNTTRNNFSVQGVAHIERNFDVVKQGKRLENIYTDLIK
ncbi:hypothetical protein CXF85_09940 [Colwellia sp. 75C3]|uniref:glycosyltransferase n=1 Tax=Colwellia sp. 75C3 TaxID=888425 RepID=UPI000C334425|nr:glycosyltransferase [Colwellia sp. 75C3]PKG83810.1 hypothetical protein CXF85_09940 [Colwellia sp. 75C3]